MGLTGGAVGAVLAPVAVTGLGVLGFSAAGPVAGEFSTGTRHVLE
jgi:hypothetical protein